MSGSGKNQTPEGHETVIFGDAELRDFICNLESAGLSPSTVRNYKASAKSFLNYLSGGSVSEDSVASYIEHISPRHSMGGVNAVISGLNRLMEFLGKAEFRAGRIKAVSKKAAKLKRELTLEDIPILIRSAKCLDNERGGLLLRTILATGLNASQVAYITLEAVNAGRTEIPKKDRIHEVMLPDALCDMLREYANGCGIIKGSIFLSKSGRPLHRADIFREIKIIAEYSGIDCNINPSSLRKLFGRAYYSNFTNILETVDIMGNKTVTTGAAFVPAPSKDGYRENINKLFMAAQGE